MKVLQRLMKLEEKYLLLQDKKSPKPVNLIIESNLRFLKTYTVNLEENKKIVTMQKIGLLMNYIQNVERLIIFERIKENTDKQLFLILTGTTEMLKNYTIGAYGILTKKK